MNEQAHYPDGYLPEWAVMTLDLERILEGR